MDISLYEPGVLWQVAGTADSKTPDPLCYIISAGIFFFIYICLKEQYILVNLLSTAENK